MNMPTRNPELKRIKRHSGAFLLKLEQFKINAPRFYTNLNFLHHFTDCYVNKKVINTILCMSIIVFFMKQSINNH